MGDCRLFVLVLLAALHKHSYCLEWSDRPQDNDVISVCVGDDVTFPWDFLTAPNEEVKDIKWRYETNSTSKLIAFYSSGVFETNKYYSKRVSYESNGSVTMTDVTMKDPGMYSISVETQDQNGVGRYQASVALQVKDNMLTEDRKLHVRQEGGAKWDNTTSTFTLTLSCGTFRFTDKQPSLQVKWTTPTGDTLNSTDYSNGRFNLRLLAPVVGGTYTCRIPPQHPSSTCLTDGRHGNNFVRVDSIQINVLQTIFEQKTLKEEAGKLSGRIVHLDAEDKNRKAEIEKLKEEDENLLSQITKAHCPPSWTLHGESCYKYISNATTWKKAQVECESRKAGLVEIDSEAENSFVFNMLVSAGAEEAWLGLSDVEEEGQFLLPSGQPPAFIKWGPGEPNNGGEIQDCATFWLDGPGFVDHWDDAYCDRYKPFVCEQHEKLKAEIEKLKEQCACEADVKTIKEENRELQSAVNKLKEEDNKLKDRIANLDAEDENLKEENEKLKAEQEQLEVDAETIKEENKELQSAVNKLKEEDNKLKDRIANLDAEDENLKEENEKLKAEQEQLETDAETIKEENRELQSAVNKLKEEDGKLNDLLSRITKVIDKCPPSWKLHGGSCYKYISNATTWKNAKDRCDRMGAWLVEIDSEAENSFVYNMLVSEGAVAAWLGLSDVGVGGQFLLPSGRPLTFTKWNQGEPNDSWGREDCATFLPGRPDVADRWNDVPCDDNMRFVCEQHVLF